MANLILKNNTSGGKTSVTADNFVGNASTASKWLTARTLTLAGDASGSVSIDGSGNVTLTVAVADSSHNHAASNITSGTLSLDRIPTISIAKGGTGATSASAARTNLGVPSTTGSGASGTWSISITGNAGTVSIPAGFSYRETSWTWGTLTTANGYTLLTDWISPASGGIAFADKGTQVSCQIDGFFYQNEGQYLVLDSNNYTSYAPSKTGSGASGTWGINVTGTASLLGLHNGVTNTSTRSTLASTWTGAVSGLKYVWGQAWKDSSIGTDSGDLVLGLRAGQYTSGGTELCMMIDGDYYSMGNKVLHAGNYSSYAAPKSHSHSYLPLSGGTVTGTLTISGGISWPPSINISCPPTANSQEWSIDVGNTSYTGSYFHVWSSRNGKTMLQCNADNNSVGIPNGPFYVGSSCYGSSLPTASHTGQVFFKV